MEIERRQAMQPFWMVLNEATSYTRYRHNTLDGARHEAERLAAENPGIRFFVLRCEGAALARRPVDWLETDDIPF